MAVLTWDNVGQRYFETGVDRGVLYIPDVGGAYTNGVAWNGLTSVNETPSGAESNPQYADNIKYVDILSAEDFGATIEAFTFPNEFYQFDGAALPSAGVAVGQQARKTFGLSYRTRVGNDVAGDSLGYKLHLVYGCSASPSERSYSTVNDSPEPVTFSWELTTVPVPVTGLRPTSIITIDSRTAASAGLTALQNALWGTAGTNPTLPTPDAVLAMFSGALTLATPTQPTYNSSTKVITIPTITGVNYYMDGVLLTAGAQAPITADKIVEARPAPGYKFPDVIDTDWFMDF